MVPEQGVLGHYFHYFRVTGPILLKSLFGLLGVAGPLFHHIFISCQPPQRVLARASLILFDNYREIKSNDKITTKELDYRLTLNLSYNSVC